MIRKVGLAMIASVSALLAQATAAQGPVGRAPVPAPTPSAAPAPAPTTTIVYTDKGPNGMSDLPMGVHRIPDSNVIISGHQKGGGIDMLFGIVGLLVQSSANAQSGTGYCQT